MARFRLVLKASRTKVEITGLREGEGESQTGVAHLTERTVNRYDQS